MRLTKKGRKQAKYYSMLKNKMNKLYRRTSSKVPFSRNRYNHGEASIKREKYKIVRDDYYKYIDACKRVNVCNDQESHAKHNHLLIVFHENLSERLAEEYNRRLRAFNEDIKYYFD